MVFPPLTTLTVGAAVTPTVIETSITHYLNRKPLRQKPTAHISYHVGLNLVRQFLSFASHHTVEEIQSFTSQWVPCPRWVRVEELDVAPSHVRDAAGHIERQLGPDGVELVGGPTWWQWRREGRPLKADWIEMRKDHNSRVHRREKCTRTMLYVHGGAYYFGSVDEHRYQMQRHARKLGARVLAPRYRLAPQFPFPCGLLDCLATYLHMLTIQPPETIMLAGDSAGGGMVMSLLVILRDQRIPMPAGAILLSPWVDLTHSFPSVAGDNELDYVPAHGFIHRPSISWPPPNTDDLKLLAEARARGLEPAAAVHEAINSTADSAGAEGFRVAPATDATGSKTTTGKIHASGNLSIMIDGESIEIKDQIQMYAENRLISHPLVSPVLQPSLGGLPPLFFLVGGGEMLRDEQIYIAHKAASPTDYPPPEPALASQGVTVDAATKHPPTLVQLQVWDDMCHVAPTLSFTRPAKYMYRAVAQFGAWALSRAQKTKIVIQEDDAVSVISSASSSSDDSSSEGASNRPDLGNRATSGKNGATAAILVGRAGDALPAFENNMLRQRVSRHGEISELEPAAAMPACVMRPEDVGSIKPGPVRKWIAAQREWNRRYAKDKRRMQERRLREMAAGGFDPFPGETPPPTALAGRRRKGYKPKPEKKKRSSALAIWSGWGSKHDETTIQREEEQSQTKKKVIDSQDNETKPLDTLTSTVSQRPTIDNHTVPFTLARPEAERTASMMTLSEEAPIVPPNPAPDTALHAVKHKESAP